MDPHHLGRIRHARLHGLEQEVRRDERRVTGLVNRGLVGADTAVKHLLGDEFEAAAVLLGAVVGVAHEHVAAGDVEVAAQRRDVGDGERSLHGSDLHVDGEAPLDGAGLGSSEHAGSIVDLLLGDPADLRDLVGRVVLQALDELVEAVAPVVNEVVIVQVLVDDDAQHAHGERAVGAGANLDPDVGLRGEPREGRIHDDELRAHAHEVDQPVADEAVGVGRERLVAPHDNNLGLLPLRIVVAIRVQLRGVQDPAVAVFHEVGGHAGLVAGVGREEAERHVRAAEDGTEAHGAVPHGVTAGAGQGDDTLGPDAVVIVMNGLADLLVGVLEPVEGFFPRDALPLVLALFAIAEERPLEAIVVVDVLDHVQAAQAQTSLVVPEIGVALDLLELAVFDVREHAAAVVTPRSGPDRGAGHFITILVPTPVCFVQIMVVFVDHEKPPFHKRDTDKMNSYSSETPKHAYLRSRGLLKPRFPPSPCPLGLLFRAEDRGFLKTCMILVAARMQPLSSRSAGGIGPLLFTQ